MISADGDNDVHEERSAQQGKEDPVVDDGQGTVDVAVAAWEAMII